MAKNIAAKAGVKKTKETPEKKVVSISRLKAKIKKAKGPMREYLVGALRRMEKTGK